MRKNKGYGLLFFLLLLAACGKPDTCASPEEYLSVCRDMLPKARVQDEGIELRAEMITPELLRILNGSHSDSLASQYDNHLAFRMILADAENGKDLLSSFPSNSAEFGAVLNYLGSGLQQDLWLMAGKDSVPCRYTLQEPTYGIRKNDPVTAGFVLPENFRNYGNIRLMFRNSLTDQKILTFEFNGTAYKRLPYLAIQEK